MPGAADLLEAIGKIAFSFQATNGEAQGRVGDELKPWLKNLVLNAAPKWMPRLAFGFPCEVPIYRNGKPVGRCPGAAVSMCDVCKHTCCLKHARIDELGDAICFLCVAEAMATSTRRPAPKSNGQAQAPDHAAELAWARKLLDVKLDTPWDEVRSAHRKLSAKNHPDKVRGAKAKEKAEAKFKEIQRAFKLLEDEHEKKAPPS